MTRGLGEEEAEGGGFWCFLSRRKVNLPSRELMEDMCVVSAHRLRRGEKKGERGTCQRWKKEEKRERGLQVWSGGEAREGQG